MSRQRRDHPQSTHAFMLARWFGRQQAIRLPDTHLLLRRRRRVVAAGGSCTRRSSTGGGSRSLALPAQPPCACAPEITQYATRRAQHGPVLSWEQRLSRYADRLQLLAAREPKRRAGLYAEDNSMLLRLGRALVQSSRRVGDSVAAFMAECLQRGEPALATSALAKVFAIDCRHDPGFLLSTATIELLLGTQTAADRMTQTNSVLLAAAPTDRRLPGHIVHAVVWAMFRRRCYREASLWAQHLSSSNIDGSVAGLVLRALREQQRAAALPPAQRRRDMSIHMYFALVDACEVNLQAQRVLRLLRRNSAGSVTEGLLAKALEIELASVPPEWRLPRTPDLLLREFRRCRIDPGTRSLLMVAGAYRTRGDPDFAQLVLAPIAANPLEASHDDASIGAVAACHALDEMRARGQRPPAPLVTSAVAWMVDAERVTDAERLWRDHGCQCAVAADRRPNVRALAKLILGYTQTGSVEKATAFFHDICAYEAAGAGTDSSAYLTGLLSAVLRSATRDIAAGGPAPARYDLLVLRIAEGFQVPFDAATYNVLFAGLSREAHVHLSAAHAAPPSQLDKIAQVMHRLYRHMAEHNVAPDDVTATHLLPLWVVLGRIDLARALWEQYMGGRSPRTADQLRGHVLNQARRWGVADRIRPLIGAP